MFATPNVPLLDGITAIDLWSLIRVAIAFCHHHPGAELNKNLAPSAGVETTEPTARSLKLHMPV
ncbi:MAG: hypothetical protein AAGD25_04230 [Cyanobacteria bacterium P01_F01_bin.150]